MQTFVLGSQPLLFCKAPCKMALESRLGVKRDNQVSMLNYYTLNYFLSRISKAR